MKRRLPLPKHFNWRALLLRFAVNVLALAITAIVVPQIYFMGNYRILTWLVISAAFGLLNAFVKPVVQFLMLPFLFISYGFVVVASMLENLLGLAPPITDRDLTGVRGKVAASSAPPLESRLVQVSEPTIAATDRWDKRGPW